MQDKTNKPTYASYEDSDQRGHMPSLIWVFAVHFVGSLRAKFCSGWERRLIRLGGCWVHRSFCGFCRAAAHDMMNLWIIYINSRDWSYCMDIYDSHSLCCLHVQLRRFYHTKSCMKRNGLCSMKFKTKTEIPNAQCLYMWKYWHICNVDNIQGPVVQSIVSLTKSLVNDSLSLLVRLKSSVLIFFAEKLWGAFALQKLLTFFRQKMAVFLCIIYLKF